MSHEDIGPATHASTAELADRLTRDRDEAAACSAEFLRSFARTRELTASHSDGLITRIVKSPTSRADDSAKLNQTRNNHHSHLRLVVNRDDPFFAAVPRKYAQGTSGRVVSTGTTPRDSRSIWIASDSPQGRRPYATLRKWPTVVRQRLAKPGRSAGGIAVKNSRKSMNAKYHHTVNDYATLFGEFTKRWRFDDNRHMGINELADIRRANTRRLIETVFNGNQAAFGREIGRSASQVNDLIRLNSAEPGAKKFGEKLQKHIETKVGLKPDQLDIPNSPLKMDPFRDARVTDEIHDAVEKELTPDERRELLDALRRIRAKRLKTKMTTTKPRRRA